MAASRLVSAFGRAGHIAKQVRLLSTSARQFVAVETGKGGYVNKSQLAGLVNEDVPDDVKDYSTEHLPVGKLFGGLPHLRDDAKGGKADYSEFKLDNEQVETYLRDGFVTNVPVLTEEQCDMLLEEIAELTDKKHLGHGLFYEFHANQSNDPNNVLLHCLGHWRIQPALHDVIFSPTISVPTSQLIGEGKRDVGVRFWHDQLFVKPPHHGGNVAWHQDYSYWTRTIPMQHMTVHIALDDQDEENGCILYVPGSHKWSRNGMPLPITADDFGDMQSIESVLTEEEKAQWKVVPALLKKGQASFHHPLSVHGSMPNRSSRPRRACVVNYFADGTISDTNEDLLKGVNVPKGERCEGRFFPLVYDPRW